MPTYVSTSSNPDTAYYFSGMSLALKYVPNAGHKMYWYAALNTAQTFTIPTYTRTFTFMNGAGQTNNLYWQAWSNNAGTLTTYRDEGNVGSDIGFGSDGNPTINEYIDPTYTGKTGFCNPAYCSPPHDSPLYTCQTNNGLNSINPGGEERQSIYVVFTSGVITSSKTFKSYALSGARLLWLADGQIALDVFIIPTTLMSTSNSNTCWAQNSPMYFSTQEIDWAVHASPSGMTISSNYQTFPLTSVGNNFCFMDNKGGTPALRFGEYVNTG